MFYRENLKGITAERDLLLLTLMSWECCKQEILPSSPKNMLS